MDCAVDISVSVVSFLIIFIKISRNKDSDIEIASILSKNTYGTFIMEGVCFHSYHRTLHTPMLI